MHSEEKLGKEQFVRTEMLIGPEAVNALSSAHVIVFGVGGVGGYVCEALARSGVGELTIVDKDVVSESNINRQIIALHSTIGKYKTEVMKERMLDINPNIKVNVRNCFYLPENAHEFDFLDYDYVVDCVDTVTAKLEIITRAKALNVPVISAMGAGNKLDPSAFKVADVFKTNVCPLAKVMRRELKKRGINRLKVVYSEEQPLTPRFAENSTEESNEKIRKVAPGSIAFVPSVAGMIIAGEVIKDLSRDLI